MSKYPSTDTSRASIYAADKFNTCQPHIFRENQGMMIDLMGYLIRMCKSKLYVQM